MSCPISCGEARSHRSNTSKRCVERRKRLNFFDPFGIDLVEQDTNAGCFVKMGKLRGKLFSDGIQYPVAQMTNHT